MVFHQIIYNELLSTINFFLLSCRHDEIVNKTLRCPFKVAKLILKGDILSTDEKLKELNLLPLDGRCLFNKSLAMFKVFHGMTPNYISSMFVRSHIHGSLNFLLPKARLDLCKTSFSFSGALVWNELPQTIKQSKSLSTFKKKLKLYYMSSL